MLKFAVFVLVLVATTESKNYFKNLHHDLSSFNLEQPNSFSQNLPRVKREVDEEVEEKIEDPELLKFFLEVAWQENKKGMLDALIGKMSHHDTNLTLIGWQRIFDEANNVQEVRTVQIVLPPKPIKEIFSIINDNDDDEEFYGNRNVPHGIINKMRRKLEPLASVGTPGNMIYERYHQNSDLEAMLFVAKDEMFAFADGHAIYNKTCVASPQEVSKFIANIKPGNLGKPTILKYDADGNLVDVDSDIKPHFLSYVLDYYEAPDHILREAPQIMAETLAKHSKEEVPKALADRFNKHFPEYNWRVLNNPQTYYLTRDVKVTLGYDNCDFDEFSDNYYVAYGVKKD